jgi:hypothetical protein
MSPKFYPNFWNSFTVSSSYNMRTVLWNLDYTGYVLDVISDAQLFSEHAGKSEIDTEDVRLAIEGKVSHSFTRVPSKEVCKLANLFPK